MRLDGTEESDNVEDRRGDTGSSGSFGGGGGGFSFGGGGGGKLGIGTILVLLLIGWVTGINPMLLIGGAEMVTGSGGSGNTAYQQQASQTTTSPASAGKPSDEVGVFVSEILKVNEDVWSRVLPEQTKIPFVKPHLVLFSGTTRSGCGSADSATGPFYCPDDQKVYLDTSFFDEMRTRFGGGGKFADAYVVSHEVGHHIENLLGILAKVDAQRDRSDQTQANALSVRIELMADCLGGVWAFHAKDQIKLEESDIAEALRTASAIGDDRLQQQARGRVVPDSFTHGTSDQRQRWFTQGWRSGSINQCNTFQATQL